MDDAQVIPFSSRTEFAQQLHAGMARARRTLDLFDPDFALFGLGTSEVDKILRDFLRQGGHMRLAMHRTTQIEQACPRFLRLLRDLGHRVECRVTNRSLSQLTDSFCIVDDADVVRRFHSDHARGEASSGVPGAADICKERFAGIWVESKLALHPTTTGL
jgi:transposase